MLASSEWERGGAGRRASAATTGSLDMTSLGLADELSGASDQTGGVTSVTAVYEMAAAIGKEFEAVIDRHGTDSVCGLMPKVIHALEELEDQVVLRNSHQEELAALKAAVERLQLDKLTRAEQRLKIEQDTLKIEEAWRAETKELQTIINNLTEENAQLAELVDSTKKSKEYRSLPETSVSGLEEVKLLQRLKDLVDAQKVDLRSQRHLLAQRTIDLDAMKLQAERLAHLNAKWKWLRRDRFKAPPAETEPDAEVVGGAAAYLADELSEVETRLRAKWVLAEEIRRHVGPSPTTTTPTPTPADSCFLNDEKTEDDVVRLLNSDKNIGQSGDGTPTSESPRFSYGELHQILGECMQLQSNVIQLKDQLDVYRRAGDDAPAVQGPINREPDEKLHHRSSQLVGVKRLFQTLIERMKG
uniref:RH1 domain-containing protein n=1 Tax=Mesocestoides corti TaxID=53468 RepID=A0A5K3FA25_MESCO